MNKEILEELIQGCKKKNKIAQKKLFMEMYNYGMSIASRYGSSREDIEEIAQDGFYKMLSKIDQYKEHIPFQLWLRRIIINCGIDHYRKFEKKDKTLELFNHVNIANEDKSNDNDHQYLLNMIDQLSPQYKMVFVLNVIDGYSHKEIAEKLSIAIGTSKSNLSKARQFLKNRIESTQQKAL